MSEKGVFAVDRGIWEHELLYDDEPFSRREAWLWLVSEAAWKPHRRRVAGRQIELERGQYVGSLRFIARKWRWSDSKVRRFLIALQADAMIDAQTDAGVTLITVCNYRDYQRVSLPNDATRETVRDAGPTQERRKVEDKEYKEVGGMVEERASARETDQPIAEVEPAPTPAPAPTPEARPRSKSLISEEAFVVAGDVIAAMGHDRDGPLSVGAPMTVQTWLSWGWAPDVIVATVKRVMAGRRHPPGTLGYFEKAIGRAIAELNAPAPTIELGPQTIRIDSHGTQTTPQRGAGLGGYSGLAAHLRQRIADQEELHGSEPAL